MKNAPKGVLDQVVQDTAQVAGGAPQRRRGRVSVPNKAQVDVALVGQADQRVDALADLR